MSYDLPPLSPERWLQGVFSAKAVTRGEIVRRKARDIERFCGWDMFYAEVTRRGFRAVRNGTQVIVFCNHEPVVPLCGPEV